MIDVLAKAAIAKAVAALPFLGWPVIGPAFAWGVNWLANYFYIGIRDELTLVDIARVNFENQTEFDKAFLKLKLIERAPDATPEQKEVALNEAHETLDKVALYQRRVAA